VFTADVAAIARFTVKITSISAATAAMEILIFFCIFYPHNQVVAGLL